MLKLEGINQYYGESHILWDISFDVKKGECTCLMGRNGVGKTTLLKCIMGSLPVRKGAIYYQDKDLTKLSAERRAHMGIGYVPQGRQI
ncbi:MAG TPA: ATP-binding cassette domain-containing protein, partial [Gammaproteobacteria bacterium]|nr:ATP-binding cassette domain-containing protein [Gammaproteobacteria bacterium]